MEKGRFIICSVYNKLIIIKVESTSIAFIVGFHVVALVLTVIEKTNDLQ